MYIICYNVLIPYVINYILYLISLLLVTRLDFKCIISNDLEQDSQIYPQLPSGRYFDPIYKHYIISVIFIIVLCCCYL